MQLQRRWSQTEIKYLKENYGKTPREEIVRKLNRSLGSIKNKIHLEKLRLRQGHTLNLTETEKAYIAGFIDGEGSIPFCIHYKKQIPHRAMPMIEIGNTNREIMNWLATKINGSAKWIIPPKVNRSSMPKDYVSRISATYHLSITGRFRIESLLKGILPYLQIKQQLAKIALQFYRQREDRFLKKFSLRDWHLVLKNREITNSRHPRDIRSRQRLAQFIKELERKEQNP